ncbi:uncharacterized protein [Anabrus simplex]|uniref:uncharacterized protein n=1 Tax=Anabrus simplex TaxID=316456 RepID=UPI0035A2B739
MQESMQEDDIINQNDDDNIDEVEIERVISPSAPFSASSSSRRSKRSKNPDPADEVLQIVAKKLKSQEEGKYMTFGRHIAEELAALDDNMATFCKKVINDAIFEAQMGTLNRTSTVVMRGVSSHPQSVVYIRTEDDIHYGNSQTSSSSVTGEYLSSFQVAENDLLRAAHMHEVVPEVSISATVSSQEILNGDISSNLPHPESTVNVPQYFEDTRCLSSIMNGGIISAKDRPRLQLPQTTQDVANSDNHKEKLEQDFSQTETADSDQDSIPSAKETATDGTQNHSGQNSYFVDNNNVETYCSDDESYVEPIDPHNYDFYIVSSLETDLGLTNTSPSYYALKYVGKQNNAEQDFLKTMDTVSYNEVTRNGTITNQSIKLEDLTQELKDLCCSLLSGSLEDEDILASSIKSLLARAYTEIDPRNYNKKTSRNHPYKKAKRSLSYKEDLNSIHLESTTTTYIDLEDSVSSTYDKLPVSSEVENDIKKDAANITDGTVGDHDAISLIQKQKVSDCGKSIDSIQTRVEVEIHSNEDKTTDVEKKCTEKRKYKSEYSDENIDDNERNECNLLKKPCFESLSSKLSETQTTTQTQEVKNDLHFSVISSEKESENVHNETTNYGTQATYLQELVPTIPDDFQQNENLEQPEQKVEEHLTQSFDADSDCSNQQNKTNIETAMPLPNDLEDRTTLYRNQIPSDYVCYLQNLRTIKKNFEQNRTTSESATSEEAIQTVDTCHSSIMPLPFSCGSLPLPSQSPHLPSIYSQQHCNPPERAPSVGLQVPNQFATWPPYCPSGMLQPNKTLVHQQAQNIPFATKRGGFISIPVDYQQSSTSVDHMSKPHVSDVLLSPSISCSMESSPVYTQQPSNHSASKRGSYGAVQFEYKPNDSEHIPQAHSRSAPVPCNMETPSSYNNPYIIKPDRIWRNYHHALRQYPGANTMWHAPWARAPGRMMQPGYPPTLNINLDKTRTTFNHCNEGFWEPHQRLYLQSSASMEQMPSIPHSSFPPGTGFATPQRAIQPGVFQLYPECSANTQPEQSRPTQHLVHRRRKLEEIVDHLKEVEKNN